MTEVVYKDESFAVQGAVFEVYRHMGHGFLESVYQECLAYELESRAIPFVSQPRLQLAYKDRTLQQNYIPDFVCYGSIILEIKAVKEILSEHKAQVINYLKTTDMKLGLLINFGAYPKAKVIRLVL